MSTEIPSAGSGASSGSVVATGSLSGPAGTPGSVPLRNGRIQVAELIDLYMANYDGRDGSRVQRLSWWRARVGCVPLEDLSDDDVHAAIEQLAAQPSRFYAGRDADGDPIFRRRAGRLSAATLNRYLAALAAVLTWAVKRRIAPKGFVHPCRTVGRRRELNEKTRFLSDDERFRLLDAARCSRWPKLRLLISLALTTGARKGELLSLSWRDIDLDKGLAHCGRTKNGDSRVLPLVPDVVDQLKEFRRSDAALVFASRAHPYRPYSIESAWREALKKAKIRDFRFHDLRHSCASMLAQNGATLLEIADVLGHRQLQVTKRYSHLTTAHKAALVRRVWGSIDGQGGTHEQ